MLSLLLLGKDWKTSKADHGRLSLSSHGKASQKFKTEPQGVFQSFLNAKEVAIARRETTVSAKEKQQTEKDEQQKKKEVDLAARGKTVSGKETAQARKDGEQAEKERSLGKDWKTSKADHGRLLLSSHSKASQKFKTEPQGVFQSFLREPLENR